MAHFRSNFLVAKKVYLFISYQIIYFVINCKHFVLIQGNTINARFTFGEQNANFDESCKIFCNKKLVTEIESRLATPFRRGREQSRVRPKTPATSIGLQCSPQSPQNGQNPNGIYF